MARGSEFDRLSAFLAHPGRELRFNGRMFEDAATPGKGEQWPALYVLRAYRAGRARIVSHGTGGAAGSEVLVAAPVQRTAEAVLG